MFRYLTSICACLLISAQLFAADRLVLDLDLEEDLLSTSHNIDNFLFPATKNYSPFTERNLNEAFDKEILRDHLIASGLVRIDGEVVGFATEQEVVSVDSDRGIPIAHSAWLILLNKPGLTGFIAVHQTEDASGVFGKINQIMQNPEKAWENKWQSFLSTSGETRVHMASGDLAVYQGGVFEEYNYLNPSDLKTLKRFRGKIQFVIYPVDGVVSTKSAP
jgi:hypothetical protein